MRKDYSGTTRLYDGKCKGDFKRIPEVSYYNHNYYIGLSDGISRDLLLAVSDDDNSTEWYLVTFYGMVKIGDSYSNEGDVIHGYGANYL